MKGNNPTRNIFSKVAPLIGWSAAAISIGVYWALAETLIHRGLYVTGFYYSPDFGAAFNGRIIFYGLLSYVLWFVFAFAISLGRRLRRRDAPSAFAARRSLLGLVAVATAVNLNVVAMYVLYERLGVPIKAGLGLPALVGAPTLLITAALFFLLSRLWRRLGRVKVLFTAIGRLILAAGLVVGAASYGVEFYRGWSRPTPAELPDVVFVTLDAWRTDAFGPEFSPEIFKFAQKNGLFFGGAWSTAPSTLQSFASTLTGSYNVTRGNSMEYKENLRPTWAQVMWEHGYDTYVIVANPYLDTVRLLHRGFTSYYNADFNPFLAAIHFYDTAWYFAIRGSTFKPEKPGAISRRLTTKALAVLRKKSTRPKFVWVHYLDPHYPYQPTYDVLRTAAPYLLVKTSYGTDRSKLDVKNIPTIKALYNYEVKTTDGYVGRLLNEIEARRNVLVIISADHGEEFTEHGNFEHRKTLYGEVTRVPLVIALPEADGKRRSALGAEAPISLIDLAPSTLSYLGLPVPRTMEGRKDLFSGNFPEEREVFSTLRQPDGPFLAALVKADRKIILMADGKDISYEYFDLTADPGEQNPLPLDHRGEELRDELILWVARRVDLTESDVDEARIFGRRPDLKALGYVK